MPERIKCKSCFRVLKPDELDYKVGDAVICDTTLTPLNNSGVILPFCNGCKESLLED